MRSQFRLKLRKQEPTLRFIEPEEKTILLDRKTKSFLAFKKFITRHILLFLLVMISFMLLFRYFYSLTNYYRSEVTVSFSGFEIPEYDDSQNSSVPVFAQMKEGLNRLYTMVYSKEMFDYLIGRFDLYTHFGLDKTNSKNYSLLRKILKSNISVFQNSNKILIIQVSDPTSGKMSADIANAIVEKSNEMNKNYITHKIENRIQIYTKLHNEIKTQTESDIRELKPQIDYLNETLSKYTDKSGRLDQPMNALNRSSEKIEDDIQKLADLNKINNWSLSVMDDDAISNVQVLQDALPGEAEENIPLWLMIPLGITVSFLLTLFIFNRVFVYKHYFKLLAA